MEFLRLVGAQVPCRARMCVASRVARRRIGGIRVTSSVVANRANGRVSTDLPWQAVLPFRRVPHRDACFVGDHMQRLRLPSAIGPWPFVA